jgi:hypothetical protein
MGNNYSSNNFSIKVPNIYAKVLKGSELVLILKKNMDDISKYKKTQPDYLKYSDMYNALFKIIIEYDVNNIEYNSLKILPKINYYKLYNNKLAQIRSQN